MLGCIYLASAITIAASWFSSPALDWYHSQPCGSLRMASSHTPESSWHPRPRTKYSVLIGHQDPGEMAQMGNRECQQMTSVGTPGRKDLSLQVCSSCYNKVPQTGWLKQQICLTVMDSGKFKIKNSADSASGEVPLPDPQRAVFRLCSHVAKRVRGLSQASLVRALIPVMRCHFPKALVLILPWGLGFQYMSFEGTQAFSPD